MGGREGKGWTEGRKGGGMVKWKTRKEQERQKFGSCGRVEDEHGTIQDDRMRKVLEMA